MPGTKVTRGTLRPMTEADLPMVLAWRNAPTIRKNMYTYHEISTDEHHEWWEKESTNTRTRLLIFEADREPLGFVSFKDYTGIDGTASWAFYSGDLARRGTGSSMEKAALAYAFNTLKLRRLECEVLSFNKRVVDFHVKHGFTVEGILRSAYRRADDDYDIYKLSMLRTEYEQLNTQLRPGPKRNKFVIDGRPIGAAQPPYVVAEMSANHNGSIDTACKIIDAAKSAGADAVKIQTYRPDTITIDCDADEFRIEGGLWDGRTLYELYEEAHTPWDWHPSLFEHARKVGITLFSAPFDKTAVDLLEDLDCPAYKIASFEAVDLPLIRYVAGTGKPMIISTGMADTDEIGEAIAAARDGGCEALALLHCVSAYPAPAEDYNLRTIPDLAERFGLVAGLSDHTLGNATAIASVALGASIIEKHFTLDRNGGGPDDSFSLEPAELKALCSDARTAWQALGDVDYGRQASESGNVQFRRSLYAVRDIQAGQTIAADDVRSIRPGYGLAPKHLDRVIGAVAKADIARGTALEWDLLASKDRDG